MQNYNLQVLFSPCWFCASTLPTSIIFLILVFRSRPIDSSKLDSPSPSSVWAFSSQTHRIPSTGSQSSSLPTTSAQNHDCRKELIQHPQKTSNKRPFDPHFCLFLKQGPFLVVRQLIKGWAQQKLQLLIREVLTLSVIQTRQILKNFINTLLRNRSPAVEIMIVTKVREQI